MSTLFSDALFAEDSLPLIVMGVPRSGTTFLQQVIDSHPNICLTDELRVFAWLFAEVKRLSAGYKAHGGVYPFNDGPVFGNYLLKNAGTLIRPFYAQLAKKRGKDKVRYWGDKYPHYNEVLQDLVKSLPRARYIMIHRDLRDVVCSVMDGHNWDAATAAAYVVKIYAAYINKITNLTAAGEMSPDAVYHLDYQAFSLNTRTETAKIFAWLGLPFDDQLASEVQKLSGIQSHSNRPGSVGAVKAFDSKKSSIERWREYLKPDQVEAVEAALNTIEPQLAKAQAWLSGTR